MEQVGSISANIAKMADVFFSSSSEAPTALSFDKFKYVVKKEVQSAMAQTNSKFAKMEAMLASIAPQQQISPGAE